MNIKPAYLTLKPNNLELTCEPVQDKHSRRVETKDKSFKHTVSFSKRKVQSPKYNSQPYTVRVLFVLN